MSKVLLIQSSSNLPGELTEGLAMHHSLVTLLFAQKESLDNVLVKHNVDVVIVSFSSAQIEESIDCMTKLNKSGAIPFVVLSLTSQPEDIFRAILDAQPYAYHQHPFSLQELLSSLEIAMRLHTGLYYLNNPFQQRFTASYKAISEAEPTMSSSFSFESLGNPDSRIEIVNNRYMKQFWIIEDADNQ